MGLKRAGFSDATIQALRQAFELLFLSPTGTQKEAVAKVREDWGHIPEVQHLLTFVETSERGITPANGRENRTHRG